MCSIISVKTEPGFLNRTFAGIFDPEGIELHPLQLRAHGFLKKDLAPVVFRGSRGRLLAGMKHFSLCPHWSRTWPFEFETYNARISRPKKTRNPQTGRWEFCFDETGAPLIEQITTVPSFRDAFLRGQTCLVPISGAVESCYFGKSAGHIVRFVPQNGILYAAGLWHDWVNPQTGEVRPTFTLLTDDPDRFVFDHGHDRGVVVLTQESWDRWLQDHKLKPAERLLLLKSQRIQPDWKIEIERKLKEGWQKRAPTESEISHIPIWRGA